MAQLTLADGSIYHERRGSGPPILFIQGIGVTGSGWGPQVEELSRDFDCISFDNRGIGRSTSATKRLTVVQMAADARALMDEVGWTSAHVVGHSMGGMIAQQLALDAPSRVRSLSLLCTFSRGAEGARLTPWVLWMSLRTRIGSRAARRRAFLEMLYPREYLATVSLDELASSLAPVIGRDLADQPPILMKQLGALSGHDCSARLKALAHIPTLVISATHDPIAAPRYGIRLAELIPGARFLEMPDAAHGVPIQSPELVNRLLREHMQAADQPVSASS